MSADPFHVGTFQDFTDRVEEVRRVLDVMRSGGRLVLFGERRQGKTAILKRAASRIRDDGGYAPYVDVWRSADLQDLNRKLLGQIPRDWLLTLRAERVLSALRGLAQLNVQPDGTPILSLAGTPVDHDPRVTFETILEGINDLAANIDEPVVLIFDEFQEIENKVAGGGPLLRAIVQNSPHVAYVFAGSILGMVQSMIGPQGPFYGVPSLEIREIPPDHLASWIEDRLRSQETEVEEGVGWAVVQTAGPITAYALELANHAYQHRRSTGRLAVGDVASLMKDYAMLQSGRYDIQWRGLHELQRNLMLALATGETQLSSAATLTRFNLGTSQNVAYHKNALRNDGLLMQSDPTRIADPFFELWIRTISAA